MRSILENNRIDANAIHQMQNFHSTIVNEVKSNIQSQACVVVGMGWNPFCTKACRLLEAKGIDYKYIEYGNYISMWKQRLAIKLWSGWPTFPQVFIDGKLVGGFTELNALLEKKN